MKMMTMIHNSAFSMSHLGSAGTWASGQDGCSDTGSNANCAEKFRPAAFR